MKARLCHWSRIWPKSDVTWRQRPIKALASSTLHKNLRANICRTRILGYSPQPAYDRIVLYPLVSIYLRLHEKKRRVFAHRIITVVCAFSEFHESFTDFERNRHMEVRKRYVKVSMQSQKLISNFIYRHFFAISRLCVELPIIEGGEIRSSLENNRLTPSH